MTYTRRTYLGATAAVLTAGLAGCVGRGTPGTPPTPTQPAYVPNEPDYKGWFKGVNTYRGTVDMRGRPAVTVRVGTKGANGFYYYDPVAVAVSPGTTVSWEWTGKGGTHNVYSTDRLFDSGAFTDEAGHTYSHTFDAPGVYRYVCQPHQTLGMKGVVFVSLGTVGAPAA